MFQRLLPGGQQFFYENADFWLLQTYYIFYIIID